jgi:Fanconi anemia group M protein
MVVFYEPIPSEIRSIQREGRTGRRRSGRVVVLITKGTRDETYSLSSTRKKRMMSAEMKRLSTRRALPAERVEVTAERGEEASAEATRPQTTDPEATHALLETQCSFHAAEKGATATQIQSQQDTAKGTADAIAEERQKTLFDFDFQEKKADERLFRVVADRREARSGVLEELEALGAFVERQTLPVADYVISNRVAVERKTDSDFIASMTERDLLVQIQELATNYERPLVVVEGADLYTRREVHQNAIRGMLAAIAVDLGVPILCSRDATETAMLLFAIAAREQTGKKRTPAVRGKKILKTLREQQEYVISAVPSVGPVTAGALLDHFGSPETIFRAPTEELTKVRGVGPQTARVIRALATTYYEASK